MNKIEKRLRDEGYVFSGIYNQDKEKVKIEASEKS